MTTFKMGKRCLMNSKSQQKISCLMLFVAVVLLQGCGLHFRKDSFDTSLLEIGQLAAQHNCKQNINYQAYQECLTQVDRNYDEIYKGDK